MLAVLFGGRHSSAPGNFESAPRVDVLTNLRTFLLVARCGGFSEAARQLRTVPSVAAKRITQLEKTVGARLFSRSTRSVKLTDAGYHLQSKAADLVAGFDEIGHLAEDDGGTLEGRLRIMAPSTLTLLRLGDVLNAFQQAHPGVCMEIALVDRSVNPLEEGFDIAISGRSASYEGIIDVPLCSVSPLLCASPEYIARRSAPAHPRELKEHDCLVFKSSGTQWLFQSARGVVEVEVPAKLIAEDNFTLLQAAEAGCGVTIIPRYVARHALSEGSLQTLLPAFPPQDNWFKAHVPRRKEGSAMTQALVAWLVQQMAPPLPQDVPTKPDGPRRAQRRRGAR